MERAALGALNTAKRSQMKLPTFLLVPIVMALLTVGGIFWQVRSLATDVDALKSEIKLMHDDVLILKSHVRGLAEWR